MADIICYEPVSTPRQGMIENMDVHRLSSKNGSMVA